MIKTVEELKEYLGDGVTIAYNSRLAIKASVNGKVISLPIDESKLNKFKKGGKNENN